MNYNIINLHHTIFMLLPLLFFEVPSFAFSTTTTTVQGLRIRSSSLISASPVTVSGDVVVAVHDDDTTTTTAGDDEDDLDSLLSEVLFRTSFFMETDYSHRVENDALRELFQFCVDCVRTGNSTIQQAGRGLFATRPIKKHTIVAFYPVHCIGCKFTASGLTQSVQIDSSEVIKHESSQYAVFAFSDEEPMLCGVNLKRQFGNDVRLYIDMNPSLELPKGWYGGLINDGSIVESLDDWTYYKRSLEKQNTVLVPFSTLPFHVAVTTRDVRPGEELFVCYGYNYWKNLLPERKDEDGIDDTSIAGLLSEQERLVVDEIQKARNGIRTPKYEEASHVLHRIFNYEMSSERPPPIITPPILWNYAAENERTARTGTFFLLRRQLKIVPQKLSQWKKDIINKALPTSKGKRKAS
jgi:hypothetical protein